MEKQGGPFIRDKATAILAGEKQVALASGGKVGYDIISFNAGSFVPRLDLPEDTADVYSVKPIERLMEAQARILELAAQKKITIGTPAGGIAHDFNNLLTGIHGYASLMKVDPDIADLHREQVLAIESYVNSARDLTAQLLGIARGGKYEIVPVDIHKLMADTAALFGRTRKEIQLHQEFHTTPLIVEADHRQIEQVVLNIFINAMHAMTAGGDLFLRTSAVNLDAAFCEPHHIEADAYVKVSITDTGIGMDADTQQKIFDPFFTTKEKGRGTGLGLASAFGIVDNHGGTITVYSEPGRRHLQYLSARFRPAGRS